MKKKIVGGILVIVGIFLLFCVTGTGDFASSKPEHKDVVSDGTLWLLAAIGCIIAAVGSCILSKKEKVPIRGYSMQDFAGLSEKLRKKK